MENYKNNTIASLAAQLKRGPKRLRLRQLLGVEFLLSVVESGRGYPFDFVRHALTGYRPSRPAPSDAELLDGDNLTSDLVLLAEDLSEDADLPAAGWSDPLYSAADLAERFDVSTKTIFRWRRRGLAGWKFRFHDRRRRVLFTDHSVRRFVAGHVALVTRGSSFSQLSTAERERVIALAQTLVTDGQRTVNSVARLISEQTGRAVETIRLILKSHDEAHPQAGLFNRAPVDCGADQQLLAIWEAYQEGTPMDVLAARFEQPIAWVYTKITWLRARALRARTIEFVPSHDFEAPDADALILANPPASPLHQQLTNSRRGVPADLPPYLAQLFRIPLLTAEGEVTLFRRMNYLKYKAHQLGERLDPETATARELDEVERLLDAAADVKNDIVQANLRLVVSIAKRHIRPQQDLFELISDGNISLMRAVDKFDYTRGFKFSTYGSWAVMRNFARSIPEAHQRHERYQTGWDEMLDNVAMVQPDDDESEFLAALRTTLERMLESLDERESSILRQRYGLDRRGQPQTLEQIGQRFGVSKERVRQLEARAINRLRTEFSHDVAALLGT